MKLIHIAHRGEAQEFLKVLNLKADTKVSGIYSNSEFALVISGEGIPETISKLSYTISKFNIDEILNFGIAGTLSSKIETGKIIEIRTTYHFEDGKPKFKSFTSNSKTTIDCITTNQRVLSDDYADRISNFAQVVDRELWGLGFVAKSFNLPFKSYKLISDIAGSKTQCFDLKERAIEFSSKLLEHFMKLDTKAEEPQLSIDPPITMSFSNKIKFQKLIHHIQTKEEIKLERILSDICVNEILDLKIRPKEKSFEILKRLEAKLNPINTIANNEMIKATQAFREIGAKVKFDHSLETKKFEISIEINSQKNLDNIKRAVDIFDYKKIEKLWSGDFNV
jgi:nucleoside phosphorylase